ncbi:TLDc domain [Cinara cedri]|uniref:MTOR-associated protein MEAK7 n=1 Tax=Cinara cedri TaxID=506608 RepID=A0A5E4N925_9HEMI|nr:TLDc domain [Cinara cedri]
MGGKGSKHDHIDPLTQDENDAIDRLMSYKEITTFDDLIHKWTSYLTPNMNGHLKQMIATTKPCRQRVVHVYRCLTICELYHASYLKLMTMVLSKSNVQLYTTDLLETIILCLKDTNEYAYWIQIGAKSHTTHQLASQLSKKGLSGDINAWLQGNTLLALLHKALITTLYFVPHKLNLLPSIDINQKYKQSFKTILDVGWIMFIKNSLPVECQENWRLLFSSSSHGESFQSLSSAIIDQGDTILILRDHIGNVFGGYASQPWLLKPKFYGDSSSFLFSLHPNLNICNASGHNDHYMYMNNGQYTLPNGIGMGGQLDYWGLWLDAEYGIGLSNVSCSTYSDYSMLSAVKDFKIDALEVWCVKEKPINDDVEEERIQTKSNRDDWDVKLLEMAGRTKYSDGLKEEHDET